MARNEHKKVLQQLSEAYQNVINENTKATAAMEFDERGFAKNTKAGKEDEYDQERKDNIEYSKRYESEDAEDDAGLWRDQMKHQPDVSPEEVERLKNRKPKPQSYSKKHPKSEKDEYHPGYEKSEGEEDDDEWNRAENERESARDRAGELSDDWMKQDYESREDSFNANVNLKDELEEIQSLADDFLAGNFEAGDHDDIAKAMHHVKTLLSDITDDGKYDRQPNLLPGQQY